MIVTDEPQNMEVASHEVDREAWPRSTQNLEGKLQLANKPRTPKCSVKFSLKIRPISTSVDIHIPRIKTISFDQYFRSDSTKLPLTPTVLVDSSERKITGLLKRAKITQKQADSIRIPKFLVIGPVRKPLKMAPGLNRDVPILQRRRHLRKNFKHLNLQTAIGALDLARQSLTRHSSTTIPIQKATIYCNSQSVVHRVNFYINHSSEALQKVTSPKP